jgi:hypothetical protein
MALTARKVRLVHKAPLEQMETTAPMERMAPMALRVLRGCKVLPVHKVPREQMVLTAPMARKVRPGLKARLVRLGPRGQTEQMVRMALMARKGRPVRRGLLAAARLPCTSTC